MTKLEIGTAVDAMAETITETFAELKPQYWQIVQHENGITLITSSAKTRAIIYDQLEWCMHQYRVEIIESLDKDVLVQGIYPIL